MSLAMTERIPSIVLTDPQNHRAAAPQSPARDPHAPPPAAEHGYGWAGAARHSRPETPKHGTKGSISRGAETGSNSPNWASPGRLIRSLSNNAMAMNNNLASSSRDGTANGNGSVAGKEETMPAMDPLSQHIMSRTNGLPQFTPSSGGPITGDGPPSRDRRESDQSEAPSMQDMAPPTRQDTQEHAHKDLKKGVKAVSFLSRLMHGSKKKEADEETLDDESISNDGRPEGNDATVFAQSMDNMGYNPRHPQPPGYIKVRSKHKKQRDFDRLFLAQELECRQPRLGLGRQNSGTNKLRRKSSASPTDGDTVWAMEFSKDGKHLAAAGAGRILRIWAVLSSPEDRQKHQIQESSGAQGQHLSAPVFQQTPVREFEGHTATILDVSWSRNNFILSSSMDKTVRLWHTSRSECLCTFKHTDFVPSIAFHPKDDRFFLTGSLDSKLRLWSISDKNVACSARLPDMITAVGFTPDGKYVMAGCLSGLCVFYETEGLKYQTQIHVRSTRGQNVKGSKITGIQSHVAASGEVKILITSNDSRVRLYNFRDKSLELKFKGNANACSQIRATLSEDGRYVVCGSEDRKAYIWSLGPAEGEKRDKRPVEMFEAHNTITTAVCFAPAKTRQLLSRSEDPVYDLCNPPPITLMSRSERASSKSSSKPPTENGSILTPAEPDARFERPKEPASYLARSHHKNGNIVVTADYTGRIKVFRQDCAWPRRRQDEWDRSSLFGKRSNGGGSKLSRTNSITTKTSQRSLRDQSIPEPRTSTSSQPPSDRILSWRQNVSSTPSLAGSRRSASKQTNRSISPRRSQDSRRPKTKPTIEPLTVLTDPADSGNRTTHIVSRDPAPTNSKQESPNRTRGDSQTSESRPSADAITAATGNDSATPPSSRSSQNKNETNPLSLEGDRSYIFWDTNHWKDRIDKMKSHRNNPDTQHSRHHHTLATVLSADEREGEEGKLSVGAYDGAHLAPRRSLSSAPSFVSKLSDERSNSLTASDDEGDEIEVFDGAPER